MMVILMLIFLKFVFGCSGCRVISFPWRGSVSLLVFSHESQWLFKGKMLGVWVSVLIIAKSLCLLYSQLMASNSSTSLLSLTNF